jgi:putative ABC transport system ATP-binding protein
MTEAMIELKSVGKTYRTDKIETVALNDIDLSIAKGEMISIMGPSGCGKSTLLNMIGLLDEPSEGELLVDGNVIIRGREKNHAKLRNRSIGFVFQSFHLVADLSVVDNVEIPLLYRKLPSKQRREMALNALERVGLSSRVNHFPTQLSGGQQQRVAIARAIVGKPRILLADEPTGNLDSHMGDEIMAILEGLNQSDGTTVVMVTHDQEKADRTQRIVRIFDGRVVH